MMGVEVSQFLEKEFGESKELAHRILHYFSGKENPKIIVTRFCSAWAEDLVVKRMVGKDNATLLKWVNMIDLEGSFRGNIFENRVHEFMTKPGVSMHSCFIVVLNVSLTCVNVIQEKWRSVHGTEHLRQS